MPSSARASALASPAPPAPPNASTAAQQGPAFSNLLPHAGHHADLQLINSMVGELCAVHATNRKAMDDMVAKYEQLRRSYDEAARPSDGEQQPRHSGDASGLAEHEELRAKLRQSQEHHRELLGQYEELAHANESYEDVMASMMVKVRDFAGNQTSTLIAWHAYYNSVIQQLRDESLQKSLEHAHWQDSLGRLDGYVREAYRSYSEAAHPLHSKIAYLKRENRVMRALLDWPEEDPDSDDETERADERADLERERERKEARAKAYAQSGGA